MGEFEYKEDKNYYLSKEQIATILPEIKSSFYKTILYRGYADLGLIFSLKNKYHICLDDDFDKTNYIKYETSDDISDVHIPNWVSEINVCFGGVPEHDVLLLDIPSNFDFTQEGLTPLAKLVFIFGYGDIDIFCHKNEYNWKKLIALILGYYVHNLARRNAVAKLIYNSSKDYL